MQTIYAVEASYDDNTIDAKNAQLLIDEAQKRLNTEIDNSANLFAGTLFHIASVAQYAEKDARTRASKYLPSQEDLHVNTKIAGNSFLWDLLDNPTFKAKIKEDKLDQKMDDEWIKKTYQSLVNSESYKKYIAIEARDKNEERNIIQHIWLKEILGNENALESFSEQWQNWDDDREMIEMLIGNYFRNSKGVNFLKFISAEKKEYVTDLLKTTLEKKEYCMELIGPKLKNWDADRVAAIDIILLRMGICEFLYFPTIPTKVTINEYIEIAKNYSTPQSGQFINGVLDNILKDLQQQNKVRKVDRK